MSLRRLLVPLILVVSPLAFSASAAQAGTLSFENSSPITINDDPDGTPPATAATPYPSTINVTGVSGPVADVNVTIRGLSHTCLTDLDIVIAGPAGQKAELFDEAGGSCTPI